MASFGINPEEMAAMRTHQDGDRVIGERAYQLIFGGTLMWGLALNCLMVVLLQDKLGRMVYANGGKNMTGWLIGGLAVYLVMCFTGSVLVRNRNPWVGFAGFHLIAVPIGLLLSVTLYNYDHFIVKTALSITFAVVAVMTIASTLFPQVFAGMGHILGISLICTLIVELLGALFFPRLFRITDWAVAGIMCLYIGFDWARMTTCDRTPRNAIAIAASLYLDIINLFLRILRILSRSRSSD